MKAETCRLAILASHPVHYHAQWMRRLSAVPGMDVTVLFCSRLGLGKHFDPTFERDVHWYTDAVLEGYRHKFLPNLLGKMRFGSLRGINPGVAGELFRGRYDALLIQSYSGITEWIALFTAKLLGCRVLFRGETGPYHRAAWWRSALRWLAMRALAWMVDLFLPIGTRSREFYLRCGIPENRMISSPYAVDNDFFCSERQRLLPQKESIRESLGIPPDSPVVLYVSKLIARKRPMDLVAAFAGLKTPASLLLVGDGPEKPRIESYLAGRGLDVRCVGFQGPAEVARFYAAGDIFVLPSEYEPWGLAVNEAMCFSLPIITTHGVAASADLVLPEENGLLYEPGDVPALAGHLRELLEDPARRIRMGQRSSQIIAGWNQRETAEGVFRATQAACGGSR